jgi:hypothetical protein
LCLDHCCVGQLAHRSVKTEAFMHLKLVSK